MRNEEILRRLEDVRRTLPHNTKEAIKVDEAILLAIDAIEERESLARTVNEAAELLRKINPRGEWRDYSDMGFVECPFCEHATTCDDNIEELHYCFFCGADMRMKEGEEND